MPLLRRKKKVRHPAKDLCWRHKIAGFSGGITTLGLKGEAREKEIDKIAQNLADLCEKCPDCNAKLDAFLSELLKREIESVEFADDTVFTQEQFLEIIRREYGL